MFRILGIAWFVIFVTAYGLIREHEDSKQKPIGIKKIMVWSLFRNRAFALWCVSGCFQLLHCFLVPFTLPGTKTCYRTHWWCWYILAYATSIGLSAKQGTEVISVTMACNFIGRLVAGYVHHAQPIVFIHISFFMYRAISDKIGSVNYSVISGTITALSTLLLWMFAHSYGTLMAYTCIFGFFGSVYFVFGEWFLSLLSRSHTLTCRIFCVYVAGPITVVIAGLEQYASGFALLNLSCIPAAISPIIANAIDHAVKQTEPYFWYKIITGGSAFLATCVMLAVRYLLKPGELWVKI